MCISESFETIFNINIKNLMGGGGGVRTPYRECTSKIALRSKGLHGVVSFFAGFGSTLNLSFDGGVGGGVDSIQLF